jgi:hypothetical protein
MVAIYLYNQSHQLYTAIALILGYMALVLITVYIARNLEGEDDED